MPLNKLSGKLKNANAVTRRMQRHEHKNYYQRTVIYAGHRACCQGNLFCMERQLCPRVHFKHIIVDGKFAYAGSANLTGAGLGIKSSNTRNFESGFITTDPGIIMEIMNQFDEVWMGKYCKSCKRKEYCNDPIL